MTRVGKYFKFGAPHFDGGPNYNWPDEERDYDELFKKERGPLGDILIPNLRKYIEEFGVSTLTPHYPHLQRGEKGLVLHLGDGGRWIELWKMLGGFLADHNMTAHADWAAGFNIGSDVLEHLDPTILAPRLSIVKDSYLMRYPLPQGQETIESSRFTEELIKKIYGVAKLSTDFKFTNTNGVQEIENSNGRVIIEKGMCEGKGFQGWEASRASWVLTKLTALCGDTL